MDEQLSFYNEEDVRDAHRAGFWSGVFTTILGLCGGAAIFYLIGVNF